MTAQPVPEVMVDADGDMLLVPQRGALRVHTELGMLLIEPCEILVIPRGFRFAVDLVEEGQVSVILFSVTLCMITRHSPQSMKKVEYCL